MAFKDAEYLRSHRKFGFRIEFFNNSVEIKRRMRIPLFLWAYLVLLGLFQIAVSFNPMNLAIGVLIFVIILLLYFWNRASKVIIDRKSEIVLLKKGFLRINHFKRYNEIEALELKTYDVPTSASPFEKGHREYIAEIRLVMKYGAPIDLLNFEDRSREKIKVAEVIHRELAEFSGLKSIVTSS